MRLALNFVNDVYKGPVEPAGESTDVFTNAHQSQIFEVVETGRPSPPPPPKLQRHVSSPGIGEMWWGGVGELAWQVSHPHHPHLVHHPYLILTNPHQSSPILTNPQGHYAGGWGADRR